MGNVSFSWVSSVVQSNMNKNFMRPVKEYLERFLDFGVYKVLIFVGNLDVITGHWGVQATLSNLTWGGRDELRNSTRGVWRVDGRPAGYVHTARNVTHILMRNAGHGMFNNKHNYRWMINIMKKEQGYLLFLNIFYRYQWGSA